MANEKYCLEVIKGHPVVLLTNNLDVVGFFNKKDIFRDMVYCVALSEPLCDPKHL